MSQTDEHTTNKQVDYARNAAKVKAIKKLEELLEVAYQPTAIDAAAVLLGEPRRDVQVIKKN